MQFPVYTSSQSQDPSNSTSTHVESNQNETKETCEKEMEELIRTTLNNRSNYNRFWEKLTLLLPKVELHSSDSTPNLFSYFIERSISEKADSNLRTKDFFNLDLLLKLEKELALPSKPSSNQLLNYFTTCWKIKPLQAAIFHQYWHCLIQDNNRQAIQECLWLGIECDNKEAINAAVLAGADLKQEQHWKGNALHLAAAWGTPEIIPLIYDQAPEILDTFQTATFCERGPLFTPLIIAFEAREYENARTLINLGASPKCNPQQENSYENVLHKAAKHEEIPELFSFIKSLLQKKTNLHNLQCDNGKTPLMLALQNGKQTTAKFLLSPQFEPVDSKLRSDEGYTALHYAALYSSAPLIKIMCQQAPELVHLPTLTKSWILTPLGIALSAPYVKGTEAFLERTKALIECGSSLEDVKRSVPLQEGDPYTIFDAVDVIQQINNSYYPGKKLPVMEYLLAKQLVGPTFLDKPAVLTDADIGPLVTSYLANPLEVTSALRAKLGLPPLQAELFALTVFYCDDLLLLQNENPSNSSQKLTQAHRFFQIIAKLPMELQMDLCNKVYGSPAEFILNPDSELAFKKIASDFGA